MRCDEASLTRNIDDPACAPPDEIDKYIEDLEVEIIVVNK